MASIRNSDDSADSPAPVPEDVTRLLGRVSDGDCAAVDQLLERVYGELHDLAGHFMRSERPDHTLAATSLAHDAFLRMVDQTRVEWHDRAHFFAVAAQAIRRILVDHARARRRHKRGGDRVKLPLDEAFVAGYEQDRIDLLDLDAALERLAEANEVHARIVEMRFFGDLTIEETARVLGISTATVERDWRYARAWLYRRLVGGAPG